METYKIIFLDIDGVLNSSEFAERNYQKTGKGLFMEDFLDPDAVSKLKTWLDEHKDIRLVISSSWRYGSIQKTKQRFSENGMKHLVDYIVGITPRTLSGERGKEIQWFIDNINTDKIGDFVEEPFYIDSYCIVDDELYDIQEELYPFIVKTEFMSGITDINYKQIETILYK